MHSHRNARYIASWYAFGTHASEAGVPSLMPDLMPHRRYLQYAGYVSIRPEKIVQYLQHPVHILDLSLSIACESINPTTGPPNCTAPPSKTSPRKSSPGLTMRQLYLISALLLALFDLVAGTALTYKLPANERICFYAQVDKKELKVAFYFAV